MKKKRRTMVPLTSKKKEKAAETFMLAALGHHRAAIWCRNNPNAKPPHIDTLLFPAVAFELALLSAEQSLRLLLLLNYSSVELDTNHNSHVLYKRLTIKSGKEEIRQDIVRKMNEIGQTQGIGPFSEHELISCLKKHDSSYTSVRYFSLRKDASSIDNWEASIRDAQLFHCFAEALISLNMDEMKSKGIHIPTSLRTVPESELTEEEKNLKERLTLP